jgi:rSAM/selenodomain-associated transferase 1
MAWLTRGADMRVLGIFAKRPVAGAVKTRLAKQTTPEWACEVAAAFLGDTLDRAATVRAERVIAFSPAEARAWFETAATGRFDLQPQVDGDLGRRMQAFFEQQVGRGAKCTVIIGADSPTLPVQYVHDAFEALCLGTDLVLGPASDGGYYLIGFGRLGPAPSIFDGTEWSSAHVLAQTVERLGPSKSLKLLPPWYDVDTLADWQVLCGHIAALRRAGIDPAVPRTEAIATSSPRFPS